MEGEGKGEFIVTVRARYESCEIRDHLELGSASMKICTICPP